jgi:hypothetical protein
MERCRVLRPSCYSGPWRLVKTGSNVLMKLDGGSCNYGLVLELDSLRLKMQYVLKLYPAILFVTSMLSYTSKFYTTWLPHKECKPYLAVESWRRSKRLLDWILKSWHVL